MSINLSVSVQIPTNVVEVGNEISTQQLGAITSGSSPTTANPFMTSSAVSTTYAAKASPTFTGVVTIPAGASISGYLTTATASSTYQTLSGMTSYLTTSAASSTYQPIGSYLVDAPSDGSEYVRKNAAWAVVTGGGGISDAPSDGSLYARQNAAWTAFTVPTLSVTNIDLTGNFNGYSMGSGYYSFKYDSTANTLRMQNGSGVGTTLSSRGLVGDVYTHGSSGPLSSGTAPIIYFAGTYTLGVPDDGTYDFPIGTKFFICAPSGSTIDNNMSGSTINGGSSYTTASSGVSVLIKVAANTWFIS
jgi:hypothetical protein